MQDNKAIDKEKLPFLPTLNKLLVELYNTFYQHFRLRPMKIEYNIPPPPPIYDLPLQIVVSRKENIKYSQSKTSNSFTNLCSDADCCYEKQSPSQIYESMNIDNQDTKRNRKKIRKKFIQNISLSECKPQTFDEFKKITQRNLENCIKRPIKLSSSLKAEQEQGDVKVIEKPKTDQLCNFSYISDVKQDPNFQKSSHAETKHFATVEAIPVSNYIENINVQDNKIVYLNEDIGLEEMRESRIVLLNKSILSDVHNTYKNQTNYFGALKSHLLELYNSFRKNIYIEQSPVYPAYEFEYTSKETQTLLDQINHNESFDTLFFNDDISIKTQQNNINPEIQHVNYIFPPETTGPFIQYYQEDARDSVQYIVAPKTEDAYIVDEKFIRNDSPNSLVTNLKPSSTITIQDITPENEHHIDKSVQFFMVPKNEDEPIAIKSISKENLGEYNGRAIILEEKRRLRNSSESKDKIYVSKFLDKINSKISNFEYESRPQESMSKNYIQEPKNQSKSKLSNMDIDEFLALRNRLSELHNNLLLNVHLERSPSISYERDPLSKINKPSISGYMSPTIPPRAVSTKLKTKLPSPTSPVVLTSPPLAKSPPLRTSPPLMTRSNLLTKTPLLSTSTSIPNNSSFFIIQKSKDNTKDWKSWSELYQQRNLKDEQTQTDLNFMDTLNPLELEDQRQKEFERRLLSTLPSTENLLTLHENDFGNKSIEIIQTMHAPIDYVLVCTLSNYETKKEITVYLKNLNEDGVENMVVIGLDNPNLVFILLHAAPTCLQHFAHVYQIEQRYRNTNYVPEDIANIKCMENDLTKRVEESPIAHRNPELFLTPNGPISSERIMILHKLLSRTCFNSSDCGLKKMIKRKHLLTAYPLHDSDCDWPPDGPLKFRQALVKYWGSMSNICKYQPLNTIEKYYGGEVAMFFAWCGFYNTMLFPAALLGILLFLSGFISFFTYDAERSIEICQHHYPVCPICKKNHSYCKFVDLSLYCTYAKITYFFDNTFTVILAIVMVLWSVIFMELWKRNEAMFKLRWNLYNFSADTYLRTEFKEKTKHRRKSKITGTLEAYIPMRIKFVAFLFTVFMCFLVCALVLAGILCGILLRLNLHTLLMSYESDTMSMNVQLITVTCSSILCLIIIRLFRLFIGKLALWLTEIENPRTQLEFDNSFTYKLVVLSFMNVYLPLFYLAMVKSTMNTTPYDWSHGSVFESDVCHPAGCMLSLCIQIYFLFLDKGIAVKLLQYFVPNFCLYLKKCICKRKRSRNPKQLPLWEKDFYLKKTERYYLAYDYLHQVTQYGLLTFFIASFPLAPIYAFISNTLQLRIFAWKLLRNTRRPVPRRLPGIGLWTPIMTFMTWVSVVTNAIIIAFTSEFINRELHKYWTGNLEGFINVTMSIFAVDDYELVPRIGEGIIECYYRGERNPASHPSKYQRRPDYWKKVSGKILFVVMFIHILLVVTGILAYSIPDVPFEVKEHRNYEQKQLRELKIKQMSEKFKQDKHLLVRKRRSTKLQL